MSSVLDSSLSYYVIRTLLVLNFFQGPTTIYFIRNYFEYKLTIDTYKYIKIISQ